MPNSYKVVLYHVVIDDNVRIVLSKSLTLPFVPRPEMRIDGRTVTDVGYDTVQERFSVGIETAFCHDLAAEVNRRTERGWEVTRP